jgi:hypothetical protein
MENDISNVVIKTRSQWGRNIFKIDCNTQILKILSNKLQRLSTKYNSYNPEYLVVPESKEVLRSHNNGNVKGHWSS